MASRYDDYIARKTAEYGDRFDASDLAPQFVRYFNSQERIRVDSHGGEHVRTGRVSVTSGWRPAFMLMHRSSDLGSSDVLGADDKIIAVQHGREYVRRSCSCKGTARERMGKCGRSWQ
jgi:hypothetical protein